MKLSKETLHILQNYAEINQSILVKEGDEIETINAMKNILSKAKVVEKFPKPFALYKILDFIALYSALKEPELDFDSSDKYVRVKDLSNGKKWNFNYAEPGVVVTPPAKGLTLPDTEIKFSLENEVLQGMLKEANILGLPDIGIKSCPNSKGIYLYATNISNDSSNEGSIQVGDDASKKVNIIFKKENLKMLPGDYDVTICRGISHFKNKDEDLDLEYWIAIEKDSTYGD